MHPVPVHLFILTVIDMQMQKNHLTARERLTGFMRHVRFADVIGMAGPEGVSFGVDECEPIVV